MNNPRKPEEIRKAQIWSLRQHPEVDKPRRPDRARVWLISPAEYKNLDPELEETNLSFEDLLPQLQKRISYKLGRLVRELYDETKVVTNARYKVEYPERGDLVYLESEIRPTEVRGKYLYDGSRVIPFIKSNHKDAVPPEFEVITQFPILYWDGRLRGEYRVYFNFNRHFPNVSLDEIQIDENNAPFFTFQKDDNLYSIYPDYDPENFDPPSDTEFLERLQNSTYFATDYSRHSYIYGGRLGSGNPEHVLFLPIF